ncbi:DNA primase small subunit-like [Clavelina lepadiformis]|uniref:DNA primase n=1 Tax=Clavelina lepadiformis TaxID=159417 RepID=A0ABP0H4K3_CLALP
MPVVDLDTGDNHSTSIGLSDAAYDAGSLPSLLPIYYKYIFPFGPYCKWLQYGSSSTSRSEFSHREFSFTLQNDIYVRYQSFTNQQELEKELQRMNPCKIDIGAIYSHPPKDHNKFHSGTFKALTKELVFDIDMTDYDDVRKCCQGAEICIKCWTLMKIAIKVLHRALTEDFGFSHILWVYSGRRGVHCWVCDSKARTLSAHARSAIVEYLSLIQGGNLEKRVALKEPVHPYIRNCLDVVKTYWLEYGLKTQDILGNDNDVDKVLKLIPDANIRDELSKDFKSSSSSSIERWSKLRESCSKVFNLDKKNRKVKYAALEIMLEYCFPRLDVNVSKGVNHLLKSPFCVHPKTGRVCVPIDVENVDSFDPFDVPTISELCFQVEKNNEKTAGDSIAESTPKKARVCHLYKKTRLQDYMLVFDKFLSKLLQEDCKTNAIEASDLKGDF